MDLHHTIVIIGGGNAGLSVAARLRRAGQDDVCLVRLNPNASGRTVNYYTGHLGRVWDREMVLNVHALGYPGNIRDGQYLQLCTAGTSPAPAICGGSRILNMGCDMTSGSSGGPWVLPTLLASAGRSIIRRTWRTTWSATIACPSAVGWNAPL